MKNERLDDIPSNETERLREENCRLQQALFIARVQRDLAEQSRDVVLNSLTWRLADGLRRRLETAAPFRTFFRRILGRGSPGMSVHEDAAGWLSLHYPEDETAKRVWRGEADALGKGAVFSIVTAVYNTPLPWLKACVGSVLAQAYPHWRLCLVDDASTDPEVRDYLDGVAQLDDRISFSRRPTNGHICAAGNTAIDMADGEWIVFLDHDDELAPHALLRVAQATGAYPQARLIYSDEDKIDGQGNRFDPCFKSGWDPVRLLSHNYVNHLCVMRRDLVLEAGKLRVGYEGAQDHDLLLRVSSLLGEGEAVHIPQVLYHWRAVDRSTASSFMAKGYTAVSGLKALRDHLPDMRVRPGDVPNTYVCSPMPNQEFLISVVILTRDRTDLLSRVVDGLRDRTKWEEWELVIVDNGSEEAASYDYFRAVEQDSRIRVVRDDGGFNYSRLNNLGARLCSGEVLLFLNNDMEIVAGDWLAELAGWAMRPGAGCVGGKLLYPDKTIQHAGIVLGINGVADHLGKNAGNHALGTEYWLDVTRSVSALTGACLAMRRTVFEQAGGFCEDLAVAYNDVDLCLRVMARGWRNLYNPHAELVHHESMSRKSDVGEKRNRLEREAAFMRERWGGLLIADPFYNPNLSLLGTDGALADAPRDTAPRLAGITPR
ncbi:MAG: glycosyltransferase family 2 protein [Pseudodesulfovibrio sp.]